VDRDRGMEVALAPNLKGWTNVPMAAILRRALGVPVVVENDVNLAVLGEHWRGAARGHETCVFVTVGTGIGAGMLVDGQLHRGHHFLSGEIGLMCMGSQYIDQDFGTRGCPWPGVATPTPGWRSCWRRRSAKGRPRPR
jgi:predicted NBD/HSP70 family sugar kinase